MGVAPLHARQNAQERTLSAGDLLRSCAMLSVT